MSQKEFQILPTDLLSDFLARCPKELDSLFNKLREAEISTDNFSFYTSVSSVYSSKIEGEDIELDSYIKHKRFGIAFSPDYTQKVDDLYNAYIFAKSNELNEGNLAHAHKLLSKHILTPNMQGMYRKQNMYVTTKDGFRNILEIQRNSGLGYRTIMTSRKN